jgi:hypothetical protein
MGWGVSSNVATEIAAIGCTIQGGQTERTNCSYELYNCDGCAIFGCEGSGTIGLPFESKIDHGSYGDGAVTITSATNHNIGPNNTHVFLQLYNPSQTDYVPNYGSGNRWGIVAATVTGPNTLTYALAPAPSKNTLTSGQWNYPISYVFRFRNVSNTLIAPGNVGSNAAVATFDMDYGGEPHIVQNNNVILGVKPDRGWILPRGVNKAAWKYIQCTGDINYLASDTTSKAQPFNAAASAARVAYPDATMNFADLPGQTSGGTVNQNGPFEGQEYTIINSNTAALGNWNAAVTGGGGNHVKVRYDGSGNWRISG